LILSWETTTKAAVSTVAASFDGIMYWNATWNMWAGSPACSPGTPQRSATTARSDPAKSLGRPSTTQPAPAKKVPSRCPSRASAASSPAPRAPSPSAGRKRRKSTCSPICGIRARITDEARPKRTRSNSSHAVPGTPPRSSPPNCHHAANCAGSFQAMKAKGAMLRTIQNGCVHSWKREIAVMP